jgi:hypothetical protein
MLVLVLAGLLALSLPASAEAAFVPRDEAVGRAQQAARRLPAQGTPEVLGCERISGREVWCRVAKVRERSSTDGMCIEGEAPNRTCNGPSGQPDPACYPTVTPACTSSARTARVRETYRAIVVIAHRPNTPVRVRIVNRRLSIVDTDRNAQVQTRRIGRQVKVKRGRALP